MVHDLRLVNPALDSPAAGLAHARCDANESGWCDRIYPIDLMPGWLKVIALANPLTYLVDALRDSMIVGGHGVYSQATSFGVMTMVFLMFLLIASRLYPGLVR